MVTLINLSYLTSSLKYISSFTVRNQMSSLKLTREKPIKSRKPRLKKTKVFMTKVKYMKKTLLYNKPTKLNKVAVRRISYLALKSIEIPEKCGGCLCLG